MRRFVRQHVPACAFSVALGLGMVLQAGCAKHADFVEMKTDLQGIAKAQDQAKRGQEAMERRLQSLETKLGASKGQEPTQTRLVDLAARLQELERRLARLEGAASARPSPSPGSAGRDVKPAPPATESGPLSLPGMTTITPTSAFNLAYNDYLNGRYDLAIGGFQRFLRDFPGNSLTPNAHYWVGESYYSLKDYVRAMQAFEKVVTGFPRSEKVPPALFKMGLSAAEIGDSQKARTLLKRVIEEFSGSDEAKLAKNKLAEIR